MRGRYASSALLVFLVSGPGWSAPAESDPAAADEAVLRAAHVASDGPGLLEFFRQRTLTGAERQHLQELVRQLDDDDFDVRERASVALSDFGPPALSALRQAAKNPSLEVARRAERCLKAAEPESPETVSAAARLLALVKPAGAAEVLLGYLPDADDDQAAAEAQGSLEAVAFHDDKADPAVLKALDDGIPARRAAAAEALCHRGKVRMAPRVRRLLKDADPGVRLRVALLLADLREDAAMPVLIASVAAAPELAAQADDYLRRLAGPQAPPATPGPSAAVRQLCRDAWTGWWQAADGRALLTLVRKGTPNERDREKTQALIALLGEDDFAVREQASDDLAKLGTVAVPLLQKAVKDPDVEVARRAERCLAQIDQGPNPGVSVTAIRLVALRKPPGAAAALLAYLPFAEEGPGVEEVEEALAALALPDGKPERALVEALRDKLALRREAAAVALCRAAGGRTVHEVALLLKDPNAGVRLRVALALTEQKDRNAVPVLIGLLGELPADRLWQAEELLRRLAGDKAPAVALGTTESTRHQCRDAWAAWWQKNAARVDLAVLDGAQRLLGYTMVVQFSNWGNNTGSVYEIGPDKKRRWQIEGLNLPIDAQVLPGNHVLIAEYYGSVVTERDFQGKILWQKAVNFPINVERLRNGNTFISGQNQVLEVDHTGKELYSINPPQGVMAARKMRDGSIAVISQGGMFMRLDTKGAELKSFPVGQTSLGGFSVLHNGHVLIPQYGQGKVAEFDANGKVVWQADVPMPSSASRLPNGNTLVACQNNQCIIEVNRAGKEVWRYNVNGRPWQARRR
jgi:HEAT repeat protein